jgi:hypothetical protein
MALQRPLTKHGVEAETLALADTVDTEVVARPSGRNHVKYIGRVSDFNVVDSRDNVADFQAGLVARTVDIDTGNEYALNRQAYALQRL